MDDRTRPDGYTVSDDRGRLDLEAVHAFLTTAYWSPGVTRSTVERAAAGSRPVGLYAPDGAQVGYARAVTDRVTFAWIADVYVLAAHRGRGLGAWLVEGLLAHPDLQGLRRILLATHDAHALYARFGFTPLVTPDTLMQRIPT